MLLDIKNYAELQKKEQIALNQKFELAEANLLKAINNISTSVFDDLINNKFKKEIAYSYAHDINTNSISIDVSYNEIKGLFINYGDTNAITEYVNAKTKAKNYLVGQDEALDIIKHRLLERIVDYLKNSNQNFDIAAGKDIPFNDRYYIAIKINAEF